MDKYVVALKYALNTETFMQGIYSFVFKPPQQHSYVLKIFARLSQQISLRYQLHRLPCGPALACQEKKSGCLHKPVKNWMQHECYCSQLHENIAVQYGNESQSVMFTY